MPKIAIEHKNDIEYVTVPLPCEADKDRDHCVHVYLLFCRMSTNKDLSVREKKGANQVDLDFMMLKLFKELLPFEKQF